MPGDFGIKVTSHYTSSEVLQIIPKEGRANNSILSFLIIFLKGWLFQTCAMTFRSEKPLQGNNRGIACNLPPDALLKFLFPMNKEIFYLLVRESFFEDQCITTTFPIR